MDVLLFYALGAVMGVMWLGLFGLWLMKKPHKARAIVVVWVLGLSPLAITIFSGRVMVWSDPPVFEETLLSRLDLRAPLIYGTTALVLLTALLVGLGQLRDKQHPAWKGLLTFWGLTLLAGLFARHPDVPLVFAALLILFFALRRGVPLNHIQNILRIYTIGSLLTVLVTPSWALREYPGSLLPFQYRLFGLTEGPQNIANLSGLSLLLEIHSGKKRYAGVALICLLLSQGKAAWIATVVGLFIYLVRRARPLLRPVGLAGIVLLLAVSGFVAGRFVGELEERQRTSILTATGRTNVWNITLDAWKDDLLFGYGPSIWQSSFEPRARFGLTWAGNAHSQYLHTLGQAGVIGALGLLTYLVLLLKTSHHHSLAFGTFGFFVIVLAGEALLTSTRPDVSLVTHISVFLITTQSRHLSVPHNSPK